jgi:hypothetical protein
MIIIANPGATFLLLAGCGLMVYLVMRKAHVQREIERRSQIFTDVHPLSPPQAPWKMSENGVEMADLARDLNGQLTTKMIVLEQLIADSQKQIERMEALLKRIEKAKRE